jgi:glutathione S-transferase
VWRVRYALAHKGLAFESVPLGFTKIQRAFSGQFKTLPVIEDGPTMLAESWDIAEYLERTYPAKPLFAGPAEQSAIAWLRAVWGVRARTAHAAPL